MDEKFSSYLVSRGISVEQYQAASIGDKGQILSVYEQQQQAPGIVQRWHDLKLSFYASYFSFFPSYIFHICVLLL